MSNLPRTDMQQVANVYLRFSYHQISIIDCQQRQKSHFTPTTMSCMILNLKTQTDYYQRATNSAASKNLASVARELNWWSLYWKEIGQRLIITRPSTSTTTHQKIITSQWVHQVMAVTLKCSRRIKISLRNILWTTKTKSLPHFHVTVTNDLNNRWLKGHQSSSGQHSSLAIYSKVVESNKASKKLRKIEWPLA